MGTKLNPGKFDCFANALPDEPMFVLLARDPDFFEIVCEWSQRRLTGISRGKYPESDLAMVAEAQNCAVEGARWRQENDGRWRLPPAKEPDA